MEDFDLAPLEARALALVEAAKKAGADAADALAIAICHAHHRSAARRMAS